MRSSRLSILRTVAALCYCATIVGCPPVLLRNDQEEPLKWKDVFGTDGPEVVDARQPAVETVVLHVAHVEQPLSDISMIDLLWKEVDQLGAFDANTRRELESNGIRVGITGPSPPPLLESMMTMDSRWRRQRTEGKMGSNEQQIPIVVGEPGSLQTGEEYERIEIKIPRGSRQETVTYESASCRFRIEVAKVQDGWVNLRFIPEIHHGAKALRRISTGQEWQFDERKNIDPIYSQQFSLMLHKGEIALMTATDDTPGSLGYAYFIGDGEDDRMQRMIVIRLDEVRSARPRLSREG